MTSDVPAYARRGLSLETVRWHILREDQQRAVVPARAGAVLSTNALVVAGIAFAVSLRGTQRPSVLALGACLGALFFVVCSVACATMTLALLPRRVSFNTARDDASAVFIYTQLDSVWPDFDKFRAALSTQSPEQQLRAAIYELWRVSQLHGYRVRMLRAAVLSLFAALVLLVLAVSLMVTLR